MDSDERQTVVSLHGIRTRGAWQESLSFVLTKEGAVYVPWKFGFFRALSMIHPGARTKKIQWFLEQYDDLRNEVKGPISIIAHSFGSYLVARSMREYDHIKFDKVILCGSIVETSFDWKTILSADRKQATAVLNQYGKKDIWVKLAQWVIEDAGPSGFNGFLSTANNKVTQQLFEDFTHSQYFFRANYENNWIPFLRGERLPERTNLKSGGPNWRFRIVKASCIGVGAAILAIAATMFLEIDRPSIDPNLLDPVMPSTSPASPGVPSASLPDPDETTAPSPPSSEEVKVDQSSDPSGSHANDESQTGTADTPVGRAAQLTLKTDADCILAINRAEQGTLTTGKLYPVPSDGPATYTCTSISAANVSETISRANGSTDPIHFRLDSRIAVANQLTAFYNSIKGSWSHTSKTDEEKIDYNCRSRVSSSHTFVVSNQSQESWVLGTLNYSSVQTAATLADTIFSTQESCNLYVTGDRQTSSISEETQIEVLVDSNADSDNEHEMKLNVVKCKINGAECHGDYMGQQDSSYLKIISAGMKISIDGDVFNPAPINQ